MDIASIYEVLYWIAIVAMAVVLVLVNAAILILSFRFMKQHRWGLGVGACIFSAFCFYLIVIMFKETFI